MAFGKRAANAETPKIFMAMACNQINSGGFSQKEGNQFARLNIDLLKPSLVHIPQNLFHPNRKDVQNQGMVQKNQRTNRNHNWCFVLTVLHLYFSSTKC